MEMQMTKGEYTSEINIWFGGNNHEAESEEHYIKKVKDQFWEDFGIKLTNAEITNIQKK
jgi:predicted adenine nucleotide alpha hydrolase (AANH) superfamily ATPase